MLKASTDGVIPIAIDQFPYNGKMYDVKGVSVRWLSEEGKDRSGQPEYGLRHFTVEPGGEIPIHNHFYVQTMYILTGELRCQRHDPDTDAVVESCMVGPGDSVYVPTMEPHSMRNESETVEATFLCCICNVYDNKGSL